MCSLIGNFLRMVLLRGYKMFQFCSFFNIQAEVKKIFFQVIIHNKTVPIDNRWVK